MPRIPYAGERFLAALGCAHRGIPVVPLHHPVVAGQPPVVACSCQEPGCPRAGAHPIAGEGAADATIDPLRISWWWRRFPAANLGLASGVGFDVLVVHGSEGDAFRWSVVAAALRAGGPLVRTGGDGWHFYFAPTGAPSQRPHGLARMEWRGFGGWVVAPPSRHASGAVSAWVRGLDTPLPDAPAAVRERLELAGPARPASPPAGPVPPARQPAQTHGRLAAAEPVARLAPVPVRD
jgi:Bifunctional DNA primase/polymerase, N-terminal